MKCELRPALFNFFLAMLLLHLMAVHYLYLRVRTARQCVLPAYMDQAACPLAPATITLPALQSTAPASAEKVQCDRFRVTAVEEVHH